jgi:hypothetical protein
MPRLAVRERDTFSGKAGQSEVVVLAVGDVFSLKTQTDADLAGDTTAFADFADVTSELIDALRPQVVVSSVLGRNFDCVDLAEKLSCIGFDGCYRLIGHGMPQPDLVLREIRSLFPDLHVELDAQAN